MENIIPIIIGVISLIIGFVIAKVLERNNSSQIIKSAKKRAKFITKQAGKDA
jgi:ribonuclease Y